ncbi:MAG TPA: D-glycerate dehydrogenase [Longimicrobiales bacterium]
MPESLVLITRRIPPAGLALLDDAGARTRVLEPDPDRIVDRAALIGAVQHAAVLLTQLTERIDREVMEASAGLRGIATMAVGYNNIDMDAANAMGIPVSNTPGVLTETTADLTFALLLGIARRIREADAYMRAGKYRIWGPELLLGTDVGTGPDGSRKTLGIIGYGRIGRAVARRARGFDMDIIAYRSGRTGSADDGTPYVSLDDLLTRSDFVSIHAPLNHDTRHLIGARELKLMRDSAFLINVGRGEIVDERALVAALRSATIAGAALDVYEYEPAMADGLADCHNVLLAPHIGSASVATRDRMAAIAARNALAHLRGERAPEVVNPAVYDSAAYRARLESMS